MIRLALLYFWEFSCARRIIDETSGAGGGHEDAVSTLSVSSAFKIVEKILVLVI
jgi:hypothetical protein